jgi:hypothetical protein
MPDEKVDNKISVKWVIGIAAPLLGVVWGMISTISGFVGEVKSTSATMAAHELQLVSLKDQIEAQRKHHAQDKLEIIETSLKATRLMMALKESGKDPAIVRASTVRFFSLDTPWTSELEPVSIYRSSSPIPTFPALPYIKKDPKELGPKIDSESLGKTLKTLEKRATEQRALIQQLK